MGEVILEDEICNAMQKAWWHEAAPYIERGVYEYDVFDDFKAEFLKLFRERMNNVSKYEQNKTEEELGR